MQRSSASGSPILVDVPRAWYEKDPPHERLNGIAPWRAGQGECRPGNAQRARPPHLFGSHEKTAEMVEARKALREVANLEDNFYLAAGVY